MDISCNNSRTVLAMTLARAFLPPMEESHAAAMRDLLADDLTGMAGEQGLDLDDCLAGYRGACARFADGEDLLVHYSSLFLSPPLAARLNLGWYLDGNLNGHTQDALARWYGTWGVDKRDSFFDLLDHLASLLEFVGLLESRDARVDAARFAGQFLHAGLDGLERDLAATAPDSPYCHLAACARQALKALYPIQGEDAKPRVKYFARRKERPDWVSCLRCGAPIATARDVAVMRRALQSSGLPDKHLELCPDCRDGAHGWEKHALPRVR